MLLLSFQGKSVNILSLYLALGRHSRILKGLPYALEVVTHKDARGLFMRLLDILKTSVPVFTQEQDNQSIISRKVNKILVG